MNRHVIRKGLLGICLLAAAPLVLADQHHMMDHHDGDRGMHHEGGRLGPAKRAEKHLGELEQKLGHVAVPIQIPVGAGDDFEAVIDLIEMKMLTFEAAPGQWESAALRDELQVAA